MKKIFEQPIMEVEAFLTEEALMTGEENPFVSGQGLGVDYWG